MRNVIEKQENMRLNRVNSKQKWVCEWFICLVKKYCKKQPKIIEHLHQQKIYYFSIYCMYKMVDISTETWNKTGVSVISIHENDDVNKTLLLLLCISGISKRWGGTNIYDLIDKEIKEKYKAEKMNELINQQIRRYKIDRSRLIKGSKQSMYISEVFAIPIIMQTRLWKPEIIKFRSDLGFNQVNLIL